MIWKHLRSKHQEFLKWWLVHMHSFLIKELNSNHLRILNLTPQFHCIFCIFFLFCLNLSRHTYSMRDFKVFKNLPDFKSLHFKFILIFDDLGFVMEYFVLKVYLQNQFLIMEDFIQNPKDLNYSKALHYFHLILTLLTQVLI